MTKLRLGAMRKWRIWGSGDFVHVHRWNFDVGGRVRPTITPDDPQRVVEILLRHGLHVSEPV